MWHFDVTAVLADGTRIEMRVEAHSAQAAEQLAVSRLAEPPTRIHVQPGGPARHTPTWGQDDIDTI